MSQEIMSITQLVGEVVKCLVDKPEEVTVEEKSGERTTVINIYASKEDVGKIIGKGGRLITALRVICENIATKNNKRVNIHIID